MIYSAKANFLPLFLCFAEHFQKTLYEYSKQYMLNEGGKK
jgi:hypothetical protein